MRSPLIEKFEAKQLKDTKALPEFRPGDTVKVHYKIREGSGEKAKFRIQVFQGVVLRRKRGKIDGSFTVRKISAGNVGVERVFPFCSPYIDKIDVVASGIVRRSRLYYLRELSGKAARIKSKFVGQSKSKDA